MNILITGGLGYLGGRLTEYLMNTKGHRVTITTIFEDTVIPDSIKAVKIQKVDVLDKTRLVEACSGIDCIIHLVALNEIVSAQKPHDALRVTVEGTLNLLEAAVEQKVKRFMYFSTFHVYGPNTSTKITEDQIPNPIHHYSTTHYMAELYVNQFRQIHKLETIIIRLSNSFGAPLTTNVDRWTLVVNDLCYQAIREGKLKLTSTGEQHRDFIPMCDVLQAVNLLLGSPYAKLGNGLFNVGAGYSISILDMCKRIQQIFFREYGKDLPIIIPLNAPKQAANPISYDISKIKALGFQVTKNFDAEIVNTLKLCEKKILEESKK